MKKTISRFRQVAYSGTFRKDGQLLAAGSEEGVVKVGVVKFVPQCLECFVQVFDTNSRAILRQCKGHTKYVS